jgi:hypothetical protein
MTCELPVGEARCDKFAHLNDYRKLRYTKSSYLSRGASECIQKLWLFQCARN